MTLKKWVVITQNNGWSWTDFYGESRCLPTQLPKAPRKVSGLSDCRTRAGLGYPFQSGFKEKPIANLSQFANFEKYARTC